MNLQDNGSPAEAKENAVLLAVAFLWAQLFFALIPVWRYGVYYEYGWLVPPVAVLLGLRRRSLGQFAPDPAKIAHSGSRLFPLLVGLAALVVLAPLRIIELANADWRPPLLFHAAIVVVCSHWLLWSVCGRRASLALIPLTVFALSAVPYPGRAETGLITTLTHWVMSVTAEIFHLSGFPVELQGDKLSLNGQLVEVTDGCSGIRSLQSLLMAALFFGELLFLGLGGRLGLLAVSAACALVLNVGRAWWLARTRFLHGPDAAQAVHDLAGHLAFLAGAVILFAAGALIRRPRVRVVVRKTIRGEHGAGAS